MRFCGLRRARRAVRGLSAYAGLPPPPVTQPRRVVVTGVGLVTPLGVGVDAVWRRLLAGESGVRALEGEDFAALPSQVGATVPRGDGEDEYSAGKWFARGEDTHLAPFVQFAVAASDQAVASVSAAAAGAPRLRDRR
jgi:3-oxoacyl-[acyl-carrier-protein] synthase II